MGYYGKKLGLIALDSIIVWVSIYLAYLFRYQGSIPGSYVHQFLLFSISTASIGMIGLYYFKLYNRLWQYASVKETLAIVYGVVLCCILSYGLSSILLVQAIPVSILVHSIETMILLIGGTRLIWKYKHVYISRRKTGDKQKALILGAGDCGSIIAQELKLNLASLMEPVAFIDDNISKQRYQVHGIPVVGGRDVIQDTVSRLGIEHIIIAMPSASQADIADMIRICKQTRAKLKLVPILNDIIEGKFSMSQIRDVEVEDLLGREPVQLDMKGIAHYVEEKTVLVTGAGGSIGSELCRQIAPFMPSKLILLGHGENSIYTIEMEIRNSFPKLVLETIISDIQDRKRIDQVFHDYRPEVVFHAAAHKHVPLMESNPAEAVKNNVLGTRNVAECADLYGAERFVLISTDKAVNPTSIMGTTKRIAEMIIQSLNGKSHTVYAAVRFGNVLGSRGSVIPRFKEQIKKGGPVTVTHPDMIRYFMTIPEAVQLVIQAGALAEGGEVFVLDMGEPVKIVDLASDLIRLSGFEPNVDIEIAFSGIRPGEKLYEEMLTDEEGISSTKHDKIYISRVQEINTAHLQEDIFILEGKLEKKETDICGYLKYIVPEFRSPQAESSVQTTDEDSKTTELLVVGA